MDLRANPKTFRGHSEDVYRQVLVVGSKSYALMGLRAPINTRVRATGIISGHNFSASSIQTMSSTVSALGFRNDPNPGHAGVLDGTRQRHPLQRTGQLFDDINGWYRDASYSALGQTGDVTPWLHIAGPTTGCYADVSALMAQARAAATKAGSNTANYDNFILYFPYCAGDAYEFAGWAYVGARDTWLNGHLDRRSSVHEQGHNYGLWHSHSYMCSEGGLSGTCAFFDYGDLYDAMGSSGYVGHFNAAQKSLLGWLSGEVVKLTAGGTATLVPLAARAAGPHAAVLRSTAAAPTGWSTASPWALSAASPPTAPTACWCTSPRAPTVFRLRAPV